MAALKAPALQACIASLATGIKPPEQTQIDALAEAGDLLLGFFADVRRIADAAETLAEAVDDNCQPALVVKTLIERELVVGPAGDES